MKRSHLVLLLAAVALLGASCGKKATVNTNTVTNTSLNANTITNTDATTGTFETNTNAGSDTNIPANATLTITASGISPKTLTIDVGTTVTIVNNDSQSHEINSNPHPDHTDLPDFLNAVPAGGSKSYTFTKVGSWGYHDHDDPFDDKWKGTVIVQ